MKIHDIDALSYKEDQKGRQLPSSRVGTVESEVSAPLNARARGVCSVEEAA
jgi:hypothetical protein